MRLMVGLGNPDDIYKFSRHNLGFHWVDRVAETHSLSLNYNKKFFGDIGKLNLVDSEIWLLKPGTYMNRSGESVVAMAKFFGIGIDQILIIHDELDLQPGLVKLKKGGGSAGHNGVKNIIHHCGDSDFWRLRLGIGRPKDGREVSNYVLKQPVPDQRLLIQKAIEKSVKTFPNLVSGDVEQARAELH